MQFSHSAENDQEESITITFHDKSVASYKNYELLFCKFFHKFIYLIKKLFVKIKIQGNIKNYWWAIIWLDPLVRESRDILSLHEFIAQYVTFPWYWRCSHAKYAGQFYYSRFVKYLSKNNTREKLANIYKTKHVCHTRSANYLHNLSVRMITLNLCIMTLIKYQKSNKFNLDIAVRKIMQQYLRGHNKDLNKQHANLLVKTFTQWQTKIKYNYQSYSNICLIHGPKKKGSKMIRQLTHDLVRSIYFI